MAKFNGTFIRDFEKREAALVLYSAYLFFQDDENIGYLESKLKVDESELDDLKTHLTEFFDVFEKK